MTARAVWKGFLKLDAVACGVKLFAATSEAEAIHFKVLNRKDRLPVKSVYVDEVTGKVVVPEDQIKGYEVEGGDFLTIDPSEIKKLKLTSDHTLDVEGFVDLSDIDTRYLDRTYYMAPADGVAAEAFAVIRDALERKKVAARSCIVLYQRGREVVIRARGNVMLMTTLRKSKEVVSERTVFDGIKTVAVDPEMLEIASLLIDKKVGSFDTSNFEDRYENALIEMINAKKAGKKPPKPVARPKENVVNLADVLRKSLEQEGLSASRRSGAENKRKAG